MDMPLPPSYRDAMNTTLLGSVRSVVKDDAFVAQYMLSPDSGFDGKGHPGMNTQDPKLEYNKRDRSFLKADEAPSIEYTAVSKDVEMERECFQKAMDDYIADTKKDLKFKMDLSSVQSIGPEGCLNFINASIDEVQTEYEVAALKGPWGKVRQAFRKLGDNPAPFTAWLGLLPTESHYLSALCGGLKLIISAAVSLRKLNHEIVELICRIPACFEKCQRLISLHKYSPQKLRTLCSQLYCAILRAMGAILEHYRTSPMRRIGQSLLRQSRYGSNLMDQIENINTCAANIADESDILMKEQAIDTNINSRRAVKDIGTLQTTLLQSQQDSNTSFQSLEEQFRKRDDSLTKEREILLEEARVFRAEASNILMEVKGLFNAQVKSQVNLGVVTVLISESRPGTPNLSSVKVPSSMTRRVLLSRLRYDTSTSKADEIANLGHVFKLRMKQQDRAVYIMEKLQPFVGAACSSMLLINGNDSTSEGCHTPLSFVCAKLTNALREARKAKSKESLPSRIICVSFFCGEHQSWREDNLADPPGVLNSLIVQLLSQYKKYDYGLLEKYETLDNRDIPGLCQLFSKLLRQLPASTVVFCIIERLSQYDDNDRSYGADLVLENLIKIYHKVAKRTHGCTFKLIITANRKLMLESVRKLGEEAILNIPEAVGAHGGFSALGWDSNIGQDIQTISGKGK